MTLADLVADLAGRMGLTGDEGRQKIATGPLRPVGRRARVLTQEQRDQKNERRRAVVARQRAERESS